MQRDGVRIRVRFRCHHLGDALVPEASAGRQNPLVDRLPGKRMHEADMGPVGHGLDEMGRGSPLDDREQCLVFEIGERCPQRQRHLLADHGGDLQRTPRGFSHSGNSAVDYVLNQRGNDNAGKLPEL